MKRLDGVPAEFFAADRHAWLRVGDRAVRCSSPGCVDWVRQANGMARLSLVEGERIVASVVYFGGDPSGVPPEVDFTMTSTEDFDFGEFVRRALDDPERLRRMFGADIEFDAGGEVPTRARLALDALPAPRRTVDLGPLARIRAAGYAAAADPSPIDDALAAFLDEVDDAPDLDPSDAARLGPPVMPLALGLTDAERDVLQLFAIRAAERAKERRDPALLQIAAVAVVLGGLDCDASSTSFVGARGALRTVADAIAALGLDPNEVVGPAGRRVGALGQWRLEWGATVAAQARDAPLN